MSALPIACTLNADDMAAAKSRYLEMTDLYRATARITGAQADIHLQGDKPPIRALLDEMIDRESSCCSFMTFKVAEVEVGYRVQIRMDESDELSQAILGDAVATFFPTAMVTAI